MKKVHVLSLVVVTMLLVLFSCASISTEAVSAAKSVTLSSGYTIESSQIESGASSVTIKEKIYKPTKPNMTMLLFHFTVVNTSGKEIPPLQMKDFNLLYLKKGDSNISVSSAGLNLVSSEIIEVDWSPRPMKPEETQKAGYAFMYNEDATICAILVKQADYIEIGPNLESQPAIEAALSRFKDTQALVKMCSNAEFAAVDEFAKYRNLSYGVKDVEGITPFLSSIISGNLSVVEGLIRSGVDIREGTYYLATKVEPIHIAVILGNTEIVKSLVKNGADVNAQSDNKNTPCGYAIMGKNLEMLKLLVDLGADINDIKIPMAWSPALSPLAYAKQKNLSDIVEYLISKGAIK